MNVGFFVEKSDPKTGGAFTLNESVLNALFNASSKHNFYFFSYYDIEASTRHKIIKLKRNGIFSRLMKKIHNRFELPYYSNNLNLAAMAKKIDFMWFLSPTLYEDVQMPFSFTIWDVQHRLQPYFPEVNFKNIFEFWGREKYYKTVLPRAAQIVSGTDTGINEISLFYSIPGERFKKIPYPTPDYYLNGHPDTSGEVLKKYALSGKFLFYPAQFWPHKNHISILLAIKKLREMNIDISAVFTGSDQGNAGYILEKINEMGLKNYVKPLGFIPIEDVAALYKRAFALVFPTYFGPDNIPPLEAMASGCPAILSEVPGAREQFGDSAMFFDPKNFNAIVDSVLKLLNDEKLRSDYILKGKERASKFNSSDYAAKIIAALDEFEPIRKCWR